MDGWMKQKGGPHWKKMEAVWCKQTQNFINVLQSAQTKKCNKQKGKNEHFWFLKATVFFIFAGRQSEQPFGRIPAGGRQQVIRGIMEDNTPT